MQKLYLPGLALVVAVFALGGCSTSDNGNPSAAAARAGMNEAIAKEVPGAYHVGRRFYKKDYKFWGFVRKSGQPWNTAQLVMLDENTKFAPDREAGKLGSDNDHEYKLTGSFTGETVYEPASNRFYPEFRLRGYELLSSTPPPIFREHGATDPARRVIPKPY